MKGCPALVGALLALGCSSSPMSHDQLESEQRQLRSLSAEELLMNKVITSRHLPHSFARAHASYMHRSAHEHVQKLSKAKAEPGDASTLEGARADAVRLEDRFIALRLIIR